jgi:hypothetical protein
VSAPSGPGPTERGYWWKMGAAQVPPTDGPWVWVNLDGSPPEWMIEARRLQSQADYDERWADSLPFWRRGLREETLANVASLRARIARIRAAEAVVP